MHDAVGIYERIHGFPCNLWRCLEIHCSPVRVSKHIFRVIQVGCSYSSMPRGLAKRHCCWYNYLSMPHMHWWSRSYIVYKITCSFSGDKSLFKLTLTLTHLSIGPSGTNINHFAIKKNRMCLFRKRVLSLLRPQCIKYDVMHYLCKKERLHCP